MGLAGIVHHHQQALKCNRGAGFHGKLLHHDLLAGLEPGASHWRSEIGAVTPADAPALPAGCRPLAEVVPLEPASMPGRVVIQWDKEDCADLGLIKVDLLGLGMMAALQEALGRVRGRLPRAQGSAAGADGA